MRTLSFLSLAAFIACCSRVSAQVPAAKESAPLAKKESAPAAEWVDPDGYAKYVADQKQKFEAVVKAETEAP